MPRTTEPIEQVAGMTTAFFSILSPGKHIPPHRGPYKGVLRYHLGLKVPDRAEQCRLRVADRTLHWEEGEGIVFDDTYEHEVRNETDEERAILFLDPSARSRAGPTWLGSWNRNSVCSVCSVPLRN